MLGDSFVNETPKNFRIDMLVDAPRHLKTMQDSISAYMEDVEAMCVLHK